MILGTQETLSTYASTYTDWAMRTAFVATAGLLARSSSTNVKTMREGIRNLVVTGKHEVPLSVQEWIKEIARERGIKESVIDTFAIHTNIALYGVEQGAAISMGDHFVVLMPLADVKKLENFLAKKMDDLTDHEKNEYHKIRFMVGHELIHIKRTSEPLISMVRQDILKVALGSLFANWAIYETLRYFSVDTDISLGVAVAFYALSNCMIIQCVLNEEYDCDKRASEDPFVIKGGVDFIEKDCCDGVIKALTQKFRDSSTAVEFYNSYKWAVEMMTLHPHPERRAACLAAYAQKLEQAQQCA